MLSVYSPAEERARPTGRKPATVTSVPVSIGNAVEAYAAPAALMRSMPASSLRAIISTTIIASSTSSPSASTSAPSEMR